MTAASDYDVEAQVRHLPLVDHHCHGVLVADIDVKSLATGLLAAVEGGYLLSQTGRDPRLMQSALNMAIGHVASYATAGTAVR